MRLTNISNLPDAIVNVAEKLVNSHPVMKPNEFSVTELQKGVKEIILSRRHIDEIEQDVQDTFALWNGTAIHELLEKNAGDDSICENRFCIDLGEWDDSLKGYLLSGSPDQFNAFNGILDDYKSTKVAEYENAKSLRETKWLYQTLAYKHFLENAGFEVNKVRIIAMIKDHSKVKAELDKDYPQNPIEVIDYSHLLNDGEWDAEMKSFYTNKVHAVIEAMEHEDDGILPCTARERFEDTYWSVIKDGRAMPKCSFQTKEAAEFALEAIREDFNVVETKGQFAVLRNGSKPNKNTKRYATKEEATDELKKLVESLSVEFRQGNPKKCRLYCNCNRFCSFYKSLMEDKNNG